MPAPNMLLQIAADTLIRRHSESCQAPRLLESANVGLSHGVRRRWRVERWDVAPVCYPTA